MRNQQYENITDYLSDMLALVRQRIALYEQYTQEGQDAFAAECLVLPAYAAARAKLDEQARVIGQMGRESLKNQVMIPLEYIFSIYRLTEFEQHSIMLLLAGELIPEFEQQFGLLMGETTPCRPSLVLCAGLFTLSQQEQLALTTAFCQRMETLDALLIPPREENAKNMRSSPLRLRPAILRFLQDSSYVDERVEQVTQLYFPADVREFMVHSVQADAVIKLLRQRTLEEKMVFYFYGGNDCGSKEHLFSLMGTAQMPMLFVDLARLLRTQEVGILLDMISNEAFLRRAWLCVAGFELIKNKERERPGSVTALLQGLMRRHHILFLLGNESWFYQQELERFRFFSFQLDPPDAMRRATVWKKYLAALPVADDINPVQLAEDFSFSQLQIKACVNEASYLALSQANESITRGLLYEAGKKQIQHELGKLASNIEAHFTWSDLVLPEREKILLRQACERIELRRKVYIEWDFASKLPYGRGVSLLFYGPAGTGKTMGAQIIANQLRMELYQVDLSAVMSKYIGETQKNLDIIFTEVKKSRSILFFDEADALFGKRSETKDAHDRYANADTAYLLQKVEQYEGMIIMASNFLQNFDDAFKRRFTYMVEFPFPDVHQRLEIWQRVFPAQTPVDEDVNLTFLADRLELSGAGIKNIALSATFLAASAEQGVSMQMILAAAKREYAKTGQILSKDDLGIYQFMF